MQHFLVRQTVTDQHQKISVIDSHTGGEPTRIIVDGGPDLGIGTFQERVETFRDQFDHIRSAVVNEPRGSDVIVGGILSNPTQSECSHGVIYFNNASYLGMCGHGTIGLMVTLNFLNQIEVGRHKLETPVGVIGVELHDANHVSVTNVPSYRYRKDVSVDVPDYGTVTGDIAWGGNWFYLIKDSPEQISLGNVRRLTDVTMRIRAALEENSITGENGALIDHLELFGPPTNEEADSKNFMLCPGGAYDRSPCGTGTSAKMACLAADGQLEPGQTWTQESVVGSLFECSIERTKSGDRIIPTIRGSAFVTGQSTLILDPNDPFRHGIRG